MKLNNGLNIPEIGLGTWLITREDCYNAVKNALEIGYRHIDTAEAYRNEIEVGRAIKDSGIEREKIFLTTKLAAEAKDYDTAIQMIEESFQKLGVDYIDLMIIHSPQPRVEVNQSENRYHEGNIQAYRALEDYVKRGKIKSIGVSNFEIEDLQNILDNCEIKPAINQILCHISNTPHELIQFCKDNDIVVEAYSPMGHGEILENKEIQLMSENYGVSIAQLCIKYTLQLGLVSLPKARKIEHMKQNFDMNFEISEDDMEILKKFPHIEDYGESSFFPVYGGKM